MNSSRKSEQPLHGQVALVTGASRGIGRAIAVALAGAGAKVGLAARDRQRLEELEREIRASGGSASVHSYDAEDVASATRLVAEVEQAHGTLDLLVNNAGINGDGVAFAQVDMAAWWRVLEVNLRAPAMLSRAALPGMLRRNSGRIINVSSGLGNMTQPNTSDYSVSKAALTRLTELIAAELAGTGVRVFAISPGMVRTDMTDKIPQLKGWTDWDAPEASGTLCVAIGSGKLDKLSGRYLGVREGIEEFVAASDRIVQEDLHVLRMNRIPMRGK